MRKKGLYLSSIFIFLFIIFLSFNVQAKEINIGSLDVNSRLLKDGSLYIEENIDFKINGEFNGVFRDVNTAFSSGVEDIQVREVTLDKDREFAKVEKAENGEDGVYEILKSGDVYRIKIYSPAKNKNKKFKISYKLLNVATKYNDIGELHYKFWTDKSETSVDEFNINLTIDKGIESSNLKAFVRDSKNGIKDLSVNVINNNTFNIKGKDLGTKTPIEVRFLFPKEAIALSSNVVNEEGLNKILNEEKSYEKSIEDEKQSREAEKKVGNIIGCAALGLNLILGIFIFKSSRKRKEIDFNTFPDECTPAVVSLLYNRYLGGRVVVATILDLVRKKYLCIESIDNDNYTIIKNKDLDENLLAHEKFIIKWFINYIGDGLKVEAKNIEIYSKEHKSEFFDYFSEWKTLVKEEFNKKGYYDSKSAKLGTRFIIISLIEILIMGVVSFSGSIISLIALLTALSVMMYSFSLKHKKSEYGESQTRHWKQFKDHLQNNNFIEYEGLKSIENIDKYLVYAVALGANNKIFENINLNYKNDNQDCYNNSCMYWYFMLNMYDSNSTIENSIYYCGHSQSSEGSDSSGSPFGGDSGGCSGGGDAGGF